jgi:threonine synthase
MSFQDAVITGQAPDGGLLLPSSIPDVTNRLEEWRGLSFVDLASRILPLFIDDIPTEEISNLIQRSYRSFDHPDVTPLIPLGELEVLELFHGPTLAFKDIALQFLGNLFEYILERRSSHLNILGSTSGDTGSAAIAGVRGKERINIFILYPRGKPSRLQELQMITVLDENVHCYAVDGSFDDCQSLMKEVFNDLPFKQQYHLGAVNSVNWARLLAQIVYYVYATLQLDRGGTRSVSFSVPTGNFGDIFAGYLARKMGLPINKLILATNENDILSVFFNQGLYRRGNVHFTISPSMDIQVASNFERYLFLRLGRNAVALNAFMQRFAETGEATLPSGTAGDDAIVATSVNTQETLQTIKSCYQAYDYIADPHTAVGIAAARKIELEGPLVCLATAHPAKFPESVKQAIGSEHVTHPQLLKLENLETRVDEISADAEIVKQRIRAFSD